MSAELVANMGLAVIEDDVAAVGYYVDLEFNKRYLGKILARSRTPEPPSPLADQRWTSAGRCLLQPARASKRAKRSVQPIEHGTALANTDVSVRFIPNHRRPARFPIPNKPAIISGSASRRAEPRARTTYHPCAQSALEAELQLMPGMGEPNIVRRSPTPKNTAD
ncbi:hypothetical protein RhiJN_21175 [Ceratobasidium sp. AG-Ba]|nr:hypothetical protein RhiJN_21175 [Ceratobasidium sp. AG-Ba]